MNGEEVLPWLLSLSNARHVLCLTYPIKQFAYPAVPTFQLASFRQKDIGNHGGIKGREILEPHAENLGARPRVVPEGLEVLHRVSGESRVAR